MEITGRLTADAEVRNVKNDKKVTGFTIAINRSYMQNGERKNIVTYVDCAYWVNTGVAEYLKKGALVLLYGDMDVNAWIDREGNAQGRLTFRTQNIKILAFAGNKDNETAGEGKAGAGKNSTKADNKKATANGAPDDDDLPF